MNDLSLLVQVYACHVHYIIRRSLPVLYGLLFIALLPMYMESAEVFKVMGFFMATVLGGVTVWASIALVRRLPPMLVTPLPLMFAFAALHFGFGPWFHITEEGALPTYGQRIFMDERDFFRVQLLNLVGFTLLLVGMWATAAMTPEIFGGKRRSRIRQNPAGLSAALKQTFRVSGYHDRVLIQGWLLFTLTSFILRASKHLIDVDLAEFLPGFLNVIDRFGWVAILLGGILAGRRGSVWWLLAILPMGIEIIDGALGLSKKSMVFPILLVFAGLYLSGKSIRTLIIGALVVALAYLASKPIVDMGRAKVWTLGTLSATEYYGALLTGEMDLYVPSSASEAGWTRLNYTPVQAGLMAAYDGGQQGNTFEDLHWMFIPRFLVPDAKPNLDFGRRTTLVLFGHEHSATGPTVFGEAYWNGGWLLVALASLVTGAIFFVMGLTALWLLLQARVVAWPLALMSIWTGKLLTNMFTKGVIGTAVVFFAFVTIFGFYNRYHSRLITRKQKHVVMAQYPNSTK